MRLIKYLLYSTMLIMLSSGCLYALKPSRVYEAIPDTLHLPNEKNTITTDDNFHLKSWTFLPGKDADNKITLVMAYADAGNMSWWLTQAAIFSQLGYTVVLFDYRGFGESDPFTIDPKMLYYTEFANDLSAVIKFAKERYPKNKTGVWCFSMGTIITTLAAQTATPDFIIGDGYVTNPQNIKEYYAKSNDIINLPASATDYTKALSNIKIPMLVFSGSQDKVTTDVSVKTLKKVKPLLTVINFKGDHMHGFEVLSKDFPGSEYAKAIEKFLKIK